MTNNHAKMQQFSMTSKPFANDQYKVKECKKLISQFQFQCLNYWVLESIINTCQNKTIDRLRTCNETNPKSLEHSMK